MTQVCGAALILLTVLLADVQDPQSANVCHMESKYDRAADKTTVRCDVVEKEEDRARIIIQAFASFPGKEPANSLDADEAARFWLHVSYTRSGANRHTQPMFRDAETLLLFLDSAKLYLPVENYRKNYFELIPSFAESGRAEINRRDLQKVLKTENLEGKWGETAFKLSDAELTALKEFISRQVFASHAQ